MEANEKVTTAEERPVEKRRYSAPTIAELDMAANTKMPSKPKFNFDTEEGQSGRGPSGI